MSIAKTYSAQLIGLRSETITIEVDISNGLHAFSIIGLGDRAVEEAKDRVAAAIKNIGFVSPKQKNQKVVVSLAPAHIRKEGPSFDLAIALAYLMASNDISFDPAGKLFLGELSLEGNIRHINGLLPILCQASDRGFKQAFVPSDDTNEASLARDIDIFPVSSLRDIVEHITNSKTIKPLCREMIETSIAEDNAVDISTVRGNESAKKGLEIAAAGGHNVVMCGPPGTGKTMLAKSFRSLLPRLSYEQSIEVTSIHSAAHILKGGLITNPPFRSPHHTASYPSIVGGGGFPKPGEITLAHRGVLFMDEFPEFDRSVIEALRQPLEDGVITISRAKAVITFPAQCILIASMNPCPCGKGKDRGCTCPQHILESYKRKISGPIMDRLDIWLNVDKVDYEKLSAKSSKSETSAEIRERITMARDIQVDRFTRRGIHKFSNGEISARDIEQFIEMEDEARSMLALSAEKLNLSGRSFHKIIKVARTIADLAGLHKIKTEHILEALQYRPRTIGE